LKIYTKTGDDGTTALFGGERVSKDDLRVEAYGNIDELNSFLGALIDRLEDGEIKAFNQKLQHILFNIGSIIATVDKRMISKLPQLLLSDIKKIELEIDRYTEDLPSMTHFILPSGHLQVSQAHICRVIARRSERGLVRLSHHTEINEQVKLSIQFINRLSDYFFVLARKLTAENSVEEVIWKKETTL